ncbi:hypothetical protein VU10_04110 [Desulfobulbus sp. US1]|nr:hypothetical protein [Desulfobulbus sp. US4]MCW5204379.1 hypothetical protein [Desulfobulbus sp. N2]MCW5207343.1 hypothetical protein [Desulfobulbus sp. US2]MCW5209367.1 hypothetical protein [Desulfobulbus sp. US1]MCW5210558.1 hypothetical protein [Desulfobulbus sp. N3]WLE97054.1 MAG: hypothetical protein QTN59_20555 [Candidatus Electrothrix communis]
MSSDEVHFLPFEVAVSIVGAIQEEEDIDDPNHQIFTVYSKEDKELCWFDFDEVIEGVKPTKGDKGKEQITDYLLHRIPDWVLEL